MGRYNVRLIHSGDIPEAYIKEIDRIFPGIVRIPVPRSKDVYDSIASHPDIFIFALDRNTLVSSPALYDGLVASLAGADIRILRSQIDPHGKYPETASINAVRIGTYLIHNVQYTDPVIRDIARKRGLESINVKQGYTRCSVIPVTENSLITCDRGIAEAAEGSGLEVELVSSGSVLLPGQKHGFIGGAAGVIPDGSVFFLGDISQHPDYSKIAAFLDRHEVGYSYIPDLPLFDAGSLIFIA